MLATNLQAGQSGHVAKHIEERQAINRNTGHDAGTVYAADYPTLQAAVDAALGGSVAASANTVRFANKTLILEPKTYTLSAPLMIYSATYLTVDFNGATLTPGNDMVSVLDLNGVAYCRFLNVHIHIPAPRVVDTGIWLYTDPTTSAWQTAGNTFYDAKIIGRYGVGFQIGNGSNIACDTTHVYGAEIQGVWQAGEDTLSQVGVSAGGGGNNIGHHFYHLALSQHATHFKALTQCAIFGGSFNYSGLDILHASTCYLHIAGVRSEHGARLYQHGLGASYPTMTTLTDIEYTANDVPGDGRWIICRNGGHLTLNNVHLVYTPEGITPVIYSIAAEPLQIFAAGLSVEGAALAEAFDTNADTNVVCIGYTQTLPSAALDSQVQGVLLQSPDKHWHALRVANDGSLSTEGV